ncbi:hypothetical protein P8452_36816 [Trifolium repens]|nr:hypothetical protein P8452_36816 [Trifolium repens]
MNNDSFAAPPLVGGMNEQIKSVYAPNEIEMTLLFLIMGWHHCVDFQYVCGWIGSIANQLWRGDTTSRVFSRFGKAICRMMFCANIYCFEVVEADQCTFQFLVLYLQDVVVVAYFPCSVVP